MTMPPVPVPAPGDKTSLPASADIRPASARPKSLMRKYEIVHLLPNGDLDEFSRIAPASPAFEDAFASLARGAILATDRGPVAIEDLLPGDAVKTVDDGFRTVTWRGSMTVIPGANGQRPSMGTLTRIAADALGIARPMPDLLLGPCARLFNGTVAARQLSMAAGAFIPARDYVDGDNIIEVTPMSAVQVFQIGFEDQQRIVANGVEIESHHPGTAHALGLRGEAMDLYLSLFPGKAGMADFGERRFPRLRLSDLDMAGVA